MNDIHVIVVWATPAVQDVVAVTLPPGATVADALQRSGLPGAYGLDPDQLGAAIAGRRVELTTTLASGDRIELTRPLTVDPKEVRRLRARAKPLPLTAKPPRTQARRRRSSPDLP